MRENIKEHLPVGLLNAGRAMRDWINRVPEDFTACTHPWRLDSRRKLQKYHNRYQGQTLLCHRQWTQSEKYGPHKIIQ